MIKKETTSNKQQIIAEYLGGTESFKALEEKYGVKARTIQTWVRAYRTKQGLKKEQPTGQEAEDIRALKKQLKEAKLKNELLEEMLRLSSQQTGVDLRKKFGSRQS
ncbi:MAG TPA: helix-turn-helix domain-containing protein [Flavisolibacter sp.]|nr:helix-turn-helix domain-containing protein [Flavisolibacter sp.]